MILTKSSNYNVTIGRNVRLECNVSPPGKLNLSLNNKLFLKDYALDFTKRNINFKIIKNERVKIQDYSKNN